MHVSQGSKKEERKMAPVGVHDGGNRSGGYCSIRKDDDSVVDITLGKDEAEPSSRRGRRRLKKKAIKDDDNDVQITTPWDWVETKEELDEYYKKRGEYDRNGYIRAMLLDLEMDEDIVGDENYELVRSLYDPFPLRKITEAELLAYNKQLEESGAFDLVDVPNNISDVDLIHPCPYFEEDPELFEDVKRSSMKAIDFYNREHRLEGKYQFVRVLKLCTFEVEGAFHYITFEAKAEDADPLCFQAEVYVPMEAELEEIEVISCRLKPES